MIDSVHKVLWKAVIMTLYSSGIRHRELRNLKITDIDSKRMCIHIRAGKGGKDRQALLSPITLACLRTYWRLCRVHNPVKSDWLFIPMKNSYGGELKKKFSHTAIGYILRKAALLAGIKKKSTRICFASTYAMEMLNTGMSLQGLMKLLGHYAESRIMPSRMTIRKPPARFIRGLHGHLCNYT